VLRTTSACVGVALFLIACADDESENGKETTVAPDAEIAAQDAALETSADLTAGDVGPEQSPGELGPELLDLAEEALPELVEPDLEKPADAAIPPVAEPEEPQPLPIAAWLVAYVPDPQKDPIGPTLDAGTFVPPTGPGKDASGVEWYERAPGENGKLGYAGYGLFYAVTVFPKEEKGGIIVRADRFMQVYVNGVPQPGDPYLSRKHRTPGAGIAGDNVVVASAYMAISDPEIEVFTTGAELYFNPSDVTAPDLVAGQKTEQWLGIPVLNMTGHHLRNVAAIVAENDRFEESTTLYPALAPSAVTQVAFQLKPKAAPAAGGESWPVRLRIETNTLDWSYETELSVPTVADNVPYRRTRRSFVDHSVQYYGVNPQSGQPGEGGPALVLSLHGAGVEAIGQAQAYGQKEWAYVVAPTNRRPFGFDWEEWGRLDGVETLNDAMAAFGIDPARVYVSGHSMGGHGTWQFGVHLSGRFRVVGPSAGWSSFYSYGGSPAPTGAFARARASSFTLDYVGNLANRAVYIIHGDADDNVPISEADLMADAVEPIADEFYFHIQPGAGHWWDGDAGAGADCVDWPPLFDLMKERTLDQAELDFTYRTPSPWVNGVYSYVSVRSQTDPYEDSIVESAFEEATATVTVTTSNVRSMVLDGEALLGKGIEELLVDGKAVELAGGEIPWGPQEGKNAETQGPFNQVFHRPFCFVYDGKGPAQYRHYVSYLVSTWNIIGNGHACALPLSKLTQEIRENNNIIYVGVGRESVPLPEGIPFEWDSQNVTINGQAVPGATLLFVFPEEGHVSAVMTATAGSESLLFWQQPFSSRAGLPDYVGWTSQGAYAAGFLDAEWKFDPALGSGAGAQ
jgi:dienelactone hydrolase